MPVAKRVRRVSNPRRKKFTRKQILAGFGGKRRKSALKSKRRRTATPKKRTATRKRNVAKPRTAARKRTVARKTTPRRTRSKNPPIVLTLGAVNPRKKRSTMAKRKRRTTTKRRRVTRRRTVRAANPVRRRRRTYRRRRNMTHRRRRTTRRRNPAMFGLRGTDMVQAVFGGLVGVAAAKFIPSAIPINLGGGNIVRVLMTGLSAVVAGWAAGKAINQKFGDAVLFGGLMQTGSVALNVFLPAIGQQIGLAGGRRGVGYLQDTAGFVVPQNPVLPPAGPPANARMNMSGLSRSFGNAF